MLLLKFDILSKIIVVLLKILLLLFLLAFLWIRFIILLEGLQYLNDFLLPHETLVPGLQKKRSLIANSPLLLPEWTWSQALNTWQHFWLGLKVSFDNELLFILISSWWIIYHLILTLQHFLVAGALTWISTLVVLRHALAWVIVRCFKLPSLNAERVHFLEVDDTLWYNHFGLRYNLVLILLH